MKYLKLLFYSLLVILLSSCESQSVFYSPLRQNTYEIYDVKNEIIKTFHGFIKAQHFIDLSFQNEGRVIYIPYTVGDFVKKGQVLARLDGTLYEIQKHEALERLNEAKINRDKLDIFYKRIDVLHKAGAVSDNEWDDASFNLKNAKQEVAINQEKIKYIDKQISYNEIKAPMDGYIYSKMADVGTIAVIGRPVLSFINANQTMVHVLVDSSVINFLNVNQKVLVKRNEKEYSAKISKISKSSLGQGGYLIKIFLDSPDFDLKEGMSVDVVFKLQTLKSFVPLNFVFFDNKENKNFLYFYSKNDSKKLFAKKVYVETGEIFGDLIEIKKGLCFGQGLVLPKNLKKLPDSFEFVL